MSFTIENSIGDRCLIYDGSKKALLQSNGIYVQEFTDDVNRRLKVLPKIKQYGIEFTKGYFFKFKTNEKK